MLRLLIAACLFTTPAMAQFKAGANGLDWPMGIIECGIVWLQPRDNDADPIYKIIITVEPNKNNTQIETMFVSHKSVDGILYDRSAQYAFSGLTTVPGKLDVQWTGAWKKNPNVRMVGRLWNQAGTQRWFYEETQFRNGSLSMRMNSRCHEVQKE